MALGWYSIAVLFPVQRLPTWPHHFVCRMSRAAPAKSPVSINPTSVPNACNEPRLYLRSVSARFVLVLPYTHVNSKTIQPHRPDHRTYGHVSHHVLHRVWY